MAKLAVRAAGLRLKLAMTLNAIEREFESAPISWRELGFERRQGSRRWLGHSVRISRCARARGRAWRCALLQADVRLISGVLGPLQYPASCRADGRCADRLPFGSHLRLRITMPAINRKNAVAWQARGTLPGNHATSARREWRCALGEAPKESLFDGKARNQRLVEGAVRHYFPGVDAACAFGPTFSPSKAATAF